MKITRKEIKPPLETITELIQIQDNLLIHIHAYTFNEFLLELSKALKGFISKDTLDIINTISLNPKLWKIKRVRNALMIKLRTDFNEIRRLYVEKGLLHKKLVLETEDTTLNNPISIFDKLKK